MFEKSTDGKTRALGTNYLRIFHLILSGTWNLGKTIINQKILLLFISHKTETRILLNKIDKLLLVYKGNNNKRYIQLFQVTLNFICFHLMYTILIAYFIYSRLKCVQFYKQKILFFGNCHYFTFKLEIQGVPRNMTVGKYFKMSSSIIF